MKVYLKFFTSIFFKSLFYVFFILFSLVLILNILTELDFFKEIDVETYFTLFLSLLNSPALIFEMFPFILLITAQLFFIKLYENKEIEILKYTGVKNTRILLVLSILSLLSGLIITTLFYHFSSSLKNFYLQLKSPYTNDSKYLAVVTKNGLWIKDIVNENTLMINSSKIEQNYLIDNYITEFNKNYEVIRNIKSDKIDIKNNDWIVLDAKIFVNNNYKIEESLLLKTNFNYKKIQSLYSNLASLNFYELLELKKNYRKLNYSTTEINLQLMKLTTYPLYLFLMTLFSGLIMLRIKSFDSSTFKISIGLFFSVIIYYLNNFFYVLGSTEKLSIIASILLPLLTLSVINAFMLININEK